MTGPTGNGMHNDLVGIVSFIFCFFSEKQLQGEHLVQSDWHFTDLLRSSKSASSSPSAGGTTMTFTGGGGGSSPKFQQRPSTPSLPASGIAADVAASSWPANYNPALTTAVTAGGASSTPLAPVEAQPAPHSTPSSPAPSPHLLSSSRQYTPPHTPPSTRSKAVSATKYPSTPPPKKKMLLFPDAQPITKSKSHESQLANRVVDIDPVK